MLILEKELLLSEDQGRIVFLNPTKSQLKSKGIKPEDKLEVVENRITDVYFATAWGSLAGNVSFELHGKLGGREFTFGLSPQKYIDYIREVNIINGYFDSDFVAFFTVLTANFVPIKTKKYEEIKQAAIEAPKLEAQARSKASTQASIDREYTKEALSKIDPGQVVMLNGGILGIYLGEKHFSYYRKVADKNKFFTKKGFGFFRISNFDELSTPKRYRQLILKSVNKIETLDLKVDLDKTFEGLFVDKQLDLHIASKMGLDGETSYWGRYGGAIVQLIHNVLFYGTANEKKELSHDLFVAQLNEIGPNREIRPFGFSTEYVRFHI